jgi:hypothetical protein
VAGRPLHQGEVDDPAGLAVGVQDGASLGPEAVEQELRLGQPETSTLDASTRDF